MSEYADNLRARMRETAQQRPHKLDVKGWGEVYIRSITLAEIEAQEEDKSDPKDKFRIARSLTRVIVDPEGAAVYDPEDDEDVKLIASQPWPLIRRLTKAIDEVDAGN